MGECSQFIFISQLFLFASLILSSYMVKVKYETEF